jgi:hypothetical protein
MSLATLAWAVSRPGDNIRVELAPGRPYGLDGNSNVVASNSGQVGMPGPVPTGGVYLPPVPSVEGQGYVPDFVATQEAIVLALSATPTPSPTPVPPTATPMSPGWEQLEALAVGPPYEYWETAEPRRQALRTYLDGLPGTVIAQDQGPQASCYDGPRGYRVEEVLFPGEVELDLGYRFTTDRYWRFIVTGGPFPTPAPFSEMTLELDNSVTIGPLHTTADRSELRTLFLHPPVALEGSTVAVKYTHSNRIELPVKLHFFMGRPERDIIVPTRYPEPDSSAYRTMLAELGYIDPTPNSTTEAARARERYERDLLYETKGTVIARNQYPAPKCVPGLHGYSIEEIALPGKVTLTTIATPVTISRFWRLNLDYDFHQYIGGAMPMRHLVCIGNSSFSEAGSNGPLNGILFDISGLQEGDPISVVFGYDSLACSSGQGRLLPEKLHFLSNPATVEPPPANPTEEACVKRADMYEFLYAAHGRVIGQGSNTLGTCLLDLESYRVEEIVLPGMTTFALDEGPVTVDRYWRLTVTSGRPQYMGGQVWIDDKSFPVKSESAISVPSGVTVLVFDRSLLREGARIRVSQSYQEQGETLPERLHLEGP